MKNHTDFMDLEGVSTPTSYPKKISQLERARALTVIARKCSDPKEAIPLVCEAISIFESEPTIGFFHEDVAIRYVTLGELWERAGDPFKAKQIYEHALSIMDIFSSTDEAGKQSLVNRLLRLSR